MNSRVSTLLAAVLVVGAIASGALPAPAATMTIRPITLAGGGTYSMVIGGTITTEGNTNTISGWNAVVTTTAQIGRYTPGNTSNMSMGPLSCDGTRLMVRTSPDGFEDGGLLFFRSSNPYQDVGVAVADFTGINAAGGQAMYMYGGAFDFLPLNQPDNFDYVVATRTTGNTYALLPIAFYGGVAVSGTITTDGTIGALGPSRILSWDIIVGEVTEDVFSPGNSSLLASLTGLDGTGTALTVLNPNGSLTFSKGSIGGHPYALILADFTSQSPTGGQAGYFHGSLSATTVELNAPAGPWLVTEISPAAVEGPVATSVSDAMRVSPNPARSSVRIEYRSLTDAPGTVELFDLLGRRVRQVPVEAGSAGIRSVAIDVGDLPAGTYFCRAQADGRTERAKLLVRH